MQTDFYGEGPLRDDNGMCVPHEPNMTERHAQDWLVLVNSVASLLVGIVLQVKALLVMQVSPFRYVVMNSLIYVMLILLVNIQWE